MGNTCQIDQTCYKTEVRQQLRKQKPSTIIINSPKISEKDLVQVKKYPISKDYVVLSPSIGKGTFGSVYKIVNKQSGMIWAAKKIPIKKNYQKHLFQILVLKQLDHPNIIRIIDVYQQQLFVYVVMEMCNGGELFDRITERENMNEEVARNFIQQVLSAVSYCHMNRIIHRDLKPENIMLISKDSDNVKIIDFGASAIYRKGQVSSVKVGSVYYIAPEVIKKSYNEKCDIWSLGVILYMMLSGVPPFNGRTDNSIFQKILQGQVKFPQKYWSQISSQAKDLVMKMLQYDPQKRISARQGLNHPWILNKKKEIKNLYINNQLNRIKQFFTMNRFKQNIMAFIVHNLTTAECIQKMRVNFKLLDTNKDGRISWNQFEKCYNENMPPISKKELRQLFEKLDRNSSGFIDYSEFVTSILSYQLLSSRQVLQKAFDLIDKDKDNFLSKEQILLAMGGVQQSFYEQMLEQCDLNKDGLVSREQFINSILNIQEQRRKIKGISYNSTKQSKN